MKRLFFSVFSVIMLLALVLPFSGVASADAPALNLTPQTALDPTTIDQFVSPLPVLVPAGGSIETIVAGTDQIEVDMKEFRANMLPDTFVPTGGDDEYLGTWVWGYVTPGADTDSVRDTYTGAVVVATRGVPTEFKFVNDLLTGATTNVLAYKYTTDQSLHWANPDGVDKYVPVTDEPVDWVGNPDHYSGAIPAAVHLHGAEDPAAIDGGPESWFVSDGSAVGKAFYSMNWDGESQNYAIYRYPNVQEAAPLWFHDHTLGATRLNVYMGLAGAYALIDPDLKLPAGLASIGLDRDNDPNVYSADEYLVPLVVQDRQFDTNGQLYFPAGPPDYSPNPEHPYWSPEFFGDTIAVNGKVWPYLEVEAQRYRFFLINGSNARTYLLTFDNPNLPIWQIGTDQGYLDKPVAVDTLVIMPGERAEFIIDFRAAPNTNLILYNLGPDEPFKGLNPDGTLADGMGGVLPPADAATTGMVMQFQVGDAPATDSSFNPAAKNAIIRTGADKIVRLVNPASGTLAKNVKPDLTRELTLNEIAREEEIIVDGVTFTGGPLEALVNNTKWMGVEPDPDNPNMMLDPREDFTEDGIGNWLTEMPAEGTTEIWEIVNTTMDAHPIHTHLAQFQLMNRQSYDTAGFWITYETAFGGAFIPAYGPPLDYGPSTASGGKYGGNPDVTPFLNGAIMPPNPNEAGWKDTVFVPPGMVTRFVVRWAPTDISVRSSSSPLLRYAFLPNDTIPYAANVDAIYDYVWHCHIVDHEDNEMMRPDAVVPSPLLPSMPRQYVMGEDY